MPPPPERKSVFLNIPYDEEFRNLYIAYIVCLCQLGLAPHLALEIPGGDRRLNKIFKLIQSCRYSIHDLSRVELSVAPTSVPRFNMPMELGMTITWQRLHFRRHDCFVFESEPYRIQQSASDLNGTDVHLHNGAAEGVFRELTGAFWRDQMPSAPAIFEVYRFVNSQVPTILSRNGTNNLYSRSVFMELCRLSISLADILHQTQPAA